MSHLKGNVGSNNGAITGFGNVDGVMHNINGASAQAAADLLIAYHQVDTTTPTFFHAPLLGNGDTLRAGVYSIAGNSTLNLVLNLDAQGNPNATFIIKIAGTFSANAFSQVKLVNGAMACNIFWKVEGAISMAAGTAMKGTLIANNAAITMNTGVLLEGRVLSTTGAVSISGITAKTPSGCGSPVLLGPTAPGLASTACYALFSGNGSVINNGITYGTGDVGTNVGLAVGYNPLTVNGTIHPIPDVSTAACAADLKNVYNYLNNLPHDIELLYPAQFGNNLVLTPHTYVMNGATSLTDSLFLDAEGNANAVFVIKINGAFSTSTYAKVLLVNGAQAANVYWKVEGAVNLNDYSEIKGTIVCNNGAISMNTGTVLLGRALTTTGALSTASVTATIQSSTGCSSLPVSWLYFRGKPVQQTVLLEWATASELNNRFFTVEKSVDGSTYQTLATVFANAGTVKAEYAFTDRQPLGLNYYRISQTDKDGKREYFNTIRVKMNLNKSLSVLHYVQQNSIYVLASGATPGNGSIELYSIQGTKISSQNILLTSDVSTYKIQTPLHKGIYLLYIESQGRKIYNAKVLIP